MKIEIPMPKMGESVMEGTIIKWHKKVGDTIKKDEVLLEISTDKVDTEVPSPAEGIVESLLFNEGDTIEVGKTIAVIGSGSVSEIKNLEIKEEKEVSKEVKKREPVKANSGGNMIDIPMPKMGESVMEGTVIKWHKKVGDSVKKDEILFEISTDKVDTEVPSPAEGIIAEILVKEQETVGVGVIVAKLSSSGEVLIQQQPKVEDVVMHDMIAQAAASVPVTEHKDVPIVNESSNKIESDRFYSPLVLNIARKENISFNELEKIQGSGLGGRVTKNDVLRYLDQRGKSVQTTEVKEAKLPEPQFEKPKFDTSFISGQVERIQMDNIRQKIMQHMVISRDTSVHVTALIEVDVTKIYNFLKQNKENYFKREGVKLTYMSFISHAAVKALKQFPLVNSTIDGTTILQKRFVNLGIAVALEPNGLIVPNIKNAHEKNVLGLAKAINEIAERARTKKLSPDDISGGTFTITNYGVFGTIFGTPIINQPEVAILGVGAVVKKPVVVEVDGVDAIAIKPMLYLTLAHDHRLVDGMLGGNFLKVIKDTLESFDGKLI